MIENFNFGSSTFCGCNDTKNISSYLQNKLPESALL